MIISCLFVPGGSSSSPVQPYDQETGGVRVRVCLAVGHRSSGSHAGLQPHQGQRQPHPVLLLHFLQRGVSRHHHPGRHAPHPDGVGVHHPSGDALVLLHPDFHFPEGAADWKT